VPIPLIERREISMKPTENWAAARRVSKARGCMRAASAVLGLASMMVPAILATASAQAQSRHYKVLYSFGGTNGDGAFPVAGLIQDAAGNLYGTTQFGGYGYGTVFVVNRSGQEKVLHSFGGTNGDGTGPLAGLIQDAAGDLYGTTSQGGAYSPPWCTSGCGTVFMVNRSGQEKVLYSFTGTGDGKYPAEGLIQDAAGNLYGTTNAGGAYGQGAVFAVNRSGKEKVLYSFSGTTVSVGVIPGALVQDAAGNFAGTTLYGGDFSECQHGCGTVFMVSRSGQEKVLHSFGGTNGDGLNPNGDLVQDAAGNFYGTTQFGGYGYGTVFVVNRSGQEKVLYSFTGTNGDGAYPLAGLILDAAGNLYGTSSGGGAYGYGTVFVVNRSGQEKVLHSFGGTNGDGLNPNGDLVQDAAGNLYGTTDAGGAYFGGMVFVLTP
jgi:uncharacterized repeat protein (TIGR03803 family)